MGMIYFALALNLFILGCAGIVKLVMYFEESYSWSYGLCVVVLINLAILYGTGYLTLCLYVLELIKTWS